MFKYGRSFGLSSQHRVSNFITLFSFPLEGPFVDTQRPILQLFGEIAVLFFLDLMILALTNPWKLTLPEQKSRRMCCWTSLSVRVHTEGLYRSFSTYSNKRKDPPCFLVVQRRESGEQTAHFDNKSSIFMAPNSVALFIIDQLRRATNHVHV